MPPKEISSIPGLPASVWITGPKYVITVSGARSGSSSASASAVVDSSSSTDCPGLTRRSAARAMASFASAMAPMRCRTSPWNAVEGCAVAPPRTFRSQPSRWR